MTDLRDGLAKALEDIPFETDWETFADAALAHLRETVPGFDALLDGSAVVVPKEPTLGRIRLGETGLATHFETATDQAWSPVYLQWRAFLRSALAASPFAGKPE